MQLIDINSKLGLYPSVNLGEMESVKLMNRFDTKYVFSVVKLPSLFGLLSESYKILEVCDKRSSSYNTIYLDTPSYIFYNQHVTGKLSRQKVRFRKYESTGATYLEVKQKTNQYRTLKWRIENNYDSHLLDEKALTFIKKYIPSDDLNLLPVISNRFTRITLVGIKTKERITFDYNIDFSAAGGKTISLPSVAIAELKSENISSHSPFIKAARQMGIRPVSFSKYCIGSALLLDMPKKNILKSRFLLLNKIENEYPESVVC